jgi:hypothetical protein
MRGSLLCAICGVLKSHNLPKAQEHYEDDALQPLNNPYDAITMGNHNRQPSPIERPSYQQPCVSV